MTAADFARTRSSRRAIERRIRQVLATSRKSRPDTRARVADLRAQVANLAMAIAQGGMRSSPALGRKLAEVKDELE